MTFLRTAAFVLVVLITSLTLGIVGLLHFLQRPITKTGQALSTLSTLMGTTATTSVKTDIHQQDYFPLAQNISASSTIPCDSNPYHISCRKNSQAVFSDGYLIVGADPGTFVVMGAAGNYGKDNNDVYWIIEGEEGPEPHAIIGADPRTFTILPGEMYAKDNSNVYWSGYKLSGADPASFTSVPCGPDECTVDARDNNHEYLAGEIVQ